MREGVGYAYDLLNRLGCVQDQPSQFSTAGSCGTSSNGGHYNPYVQNTYDTSKLTISGTTDYPVGRLTQSISTTYFSGSAASVTESYEHDARGRSSGEQLQFSLPSSWNVTNGLPINPPPRRPPVRTQAGRALPPRWPMTARARSPG